MVKNNQLKRLFKRQIKRLKKLNCPPEIIKFLKSKKDLVISEANKISYKEEEIPFLPVIPRTLINLNELMKMVYFKDMRGENYLSQYLVIDNIKTPKIPYYIFNVNGGKLFLGIDPKTAIKILNKVSEIDNKPRIPLTIDEVIALVIHSNILSRNYYLWAGGSSCVSTLSGNIPFLYITGRYTPVLSYNSENCSSLYSGVPFCQKKI